MKTFEYDLHKVKCKVAKTFIRETTQVGGLLNTMGMI